MARSHLPSAVRVLIAASTMLVPVPAAGATLNAFADFFLIEAGAGTTLFEQNLLFLVPRFDPSLGTLDAIVLSVVRGGVVATVDVDSEAPFAAAVFQDSVVAVANTTVSYVGGQLAAISGDAQIGPSPGFILPADSDGVPDFAGSDAAQFSGLIAASVIDAAITDPAILMDFTGPFFLPLVLEIRELASSGIPGIQEIQASYGSGIGAISVSYNYTPAGPTSTPVVPEPGTFVLLGLSSAACVVRRMCRRRRGSWIG